MTRDISGPKFCEPFVFFDHDSLCWKTCEATLLEDSTRFSGIWPVAGSMRNGWCYKRLTAVPLIDELDCSSWLFQTPTVSDSKGAPASGRNRPRGPGKLSEQLIELLPTPTASQPGGTAEQHLARKAKINDGANRTSITDLRMACEVLLPTPTACDSKGSRNSTANRRPGSTGRIGDTLTDAAWKLLPTPTARLGTPRGAQPAQYQNPERSNDLDDAVAWVLQRTGDDSLRRSSDGND